MNFNLDEWLRSIGMCQYYDNFYEHGYTNLKVCSNLDEADLHEMCITRRGHVKTILLYSQDLKKWEFTQNHCPFVKHQPSLLSATPSLGKIKVPHRLPQIKQVSNYNEITPPSTASQSPRDVPIINRGPRQLTESYHKRAKREGTPTEADVEVDILLVRHGESQANVDASLYTSTADHAVELSKRGIDQAAKTGEQIRKYYEEQYGPKIPDDWKCRIWTSTYKRARQTAEILRTNSGGWITDIRENIFLVEQQFGLFEGVEWASGMVDTQFPQELHHYNKCATFGGRFWARVPMGESRFDVCRRVYHSIAPITQDAVKHNIKHVIIVSHGVTLRAFMMCYFNLTPEWFEEEPNPTNCSVRLIRDHKDVGYIWPRKEEIAKETYPDSDLLLIKAMEFVNQQLQKLISQKKEEDERENKKQKKKQIHE